MQISFKHALSVIVWHSTEIFISDTHVIYAFSKFTQPFTVYTYTISRIWQISAVNGDDRLGCTIRQGYVTLWFSYLLRWLIIDGWRHTLQRTWLVIDFCKFRWEKMTLTRLWMACNKLVQQLAFSISFCSFLGLVTYFYSARAQFYSVLYSLAY